MSDKKPNPSDPPAELSESQYLERQAQHARQAMRLALKAAQNRLVEGIDPRLWTKEFPWIAVGVATTAGFAAAAAAIPSKKQQVLRRLHKLEEQLRVKTQPAATEASSNGKHKAKAQSSWSSGILKEIVSVAKPLIVAAMSAGMGAKAGQQAAQPDAQAAGEELDPASSI